jgi:hypothetical protein
VVSSLPAMSEPFERIDFWEPVPGEPAGAWRGRMLDALLAGAEEETLGLRALNAFLIHPDPAVRATALRAWTCIGLSLVGNDQSHDRVRSLLDDPSREVRLEAIRCCREAGVRENVPGLLLVLREDEAVRREFRESAPGRRPPMARELFRALEALDAVEAVPLLEALGVASRWLRRRSRPASTPAGFVGRYVPAAEARTSFLPAQDLRENPDCPVCRQPVRVIAVVEEPFGPAGAGKVPFYRCLSCTTHSALFVELGPPARCLGSPAADSQSGFRGPEPGELPWGLAWTPRTPAAEVDPYTPLLGGETDWVQEDETPVCPACEEKMDFVIKLPGEPDKFPLVEFQGVAYGFWCGGCRVSATHFQV